MKGAGDEGRGPRAKGQGETRNLGVSYLIGVPWREGNGRGKPLPYGGTQVAEVVLRGEREGQAPPLRWHPNSRSCVAGEAGGASPSPTVRIPAILILMSMGNGRK